MKNVRQIVSTLETYQLAESMCEKTSFLTGNEEKLGITQCNGQLPPKAWEFMKPGTLEGVLFAPKWVNKAVTI